MNRASYPMRKSTLENRSTLDSEWFLVSTLGHSSAAMILGSMTPDSEKPHGCARSGTAHKFG